MIAAHKALKIRYREGAVRYVLVHRYGRFVALFFAHKAQFPKKRNRVQDGLDHFPPITGQGAALHRAFEQKINPVGWVASFVKGRVLWLRLPFYHGAQFCELALGQAIEQGEIAEDFYCVGGIHKQGFFCFWIRFP
jgi:hypothetical protein